MIKTPSKVQYCQSLTEYKRFPTREVRAGSVAIGGENPIRLQSMTTTDTMDTEASVEESLRMIRAGCEIVRLTAPTKNDAANLAAIKEAIRNAGYDTPLVADIHFTPNAAEIAARIVEKVRVNPGNYADKKKFENIEYTDESYALELERIRTRFTPLVRICKEEGTAMRIGTNHGSLSDRIMSRYGDTPRGMVESAMEFLRICRENDFHDIVLSMKASNPIVMVQAYRLLVRTMMEEGMNYPLHLGVTEAGEGEDGRIKSAVGIGTLLEDGLGDTVRVSLTEEPEFEAPVAMALVNRYVKRIENSVPAEVYSENESAVLPYATYFKRETKEVNNFIGGSMVPRVLVDISRENLLDPFTLMSVGYRYDMLLDKYHMGDQSVDFVYLADSLPSFTMPANLKQVYIYNTWIVLKDKTNILLFFSFEENVSASDHDASINFVIINNDDLSGEAFGSLQIDKTLVFILETNVEHGMADQRQFFCKLIELGIDIPVVIKRTYKSSDFNGPLGDLMSVEEPVSKLQLYAGTDFGALLTSGLGDGIWIDSEATDLDRIVSTSFGILQATRSRISKTEYISCPSCGRTLFDLQETTQLIRARTNHLKGLKIGIMGCIVNGPGEMADADYGYVGAGPGKITLYRGKEVVKKNVDTKNALNKLIEIIREDGKWVDIEDV